MKNMRLDSNIKPDILQLSIRLYRIDLVEIEEVELGLEKKREKLERVRETVFTYISFGRKQEKAREPRESQVKRIRIVELCSSELRVKKRSQGGSHGRKSQKICTFSMSDAVEIVRRSQ
ncbi:hypothetical protein MTR_6g021640 [Medicago truncatula]|uniref:Uncharacterized protein n=1 Tax=Medicago truncatula TaxID=3880 RepID=G7KN49_MEDTR|nr:hypothetical protein MTR_6g021640 [Medicago truncatula]